MDSEYNFASNIDLAVIAPDGDKSRTYQTLF